MTNPSRLLREHALAFRSLHVPGRPLILPNAWDVASARLVEDAGAGAVATTSAGVAWALGAADGERLDRERAPAVVAGIAGAVRVPVTADVESGWADDPAGVARTVRAVLDAGAVGVNIEDALHGPGPAPLRPVAEHLAAGADGIFVPGAVDPETVREPAGGIDAPLNVMAGPGAPPAGELAALGVARVSVGAGIAQAAHALVRRAARELLGTGTYGAQDAGLDYGTLNTLMGEGR